MKFDYWHQYYRVTGIRVDFAPIVANNISYVPNAPGPTKQYGQPWTFNNSEKDLVGGKVVSELNDWLTLRTAYRYGTMYRDNTYIDALFTSNTAYKEQVVQTTRQVETTLAGYGLFDSKLNTFGITHDVTFGYTNAYYYYTRGPNVITPSIGVSNVNDPASFAEPEPAIPGTSNFQSQNLGNFLVGDRITINKYWSAIVGVDEAMVNQGGAGSSAIPTFNSGVLSTASYNQDKLTPTYSLLFKPISDVTFYATYLELLSLGDTAPVTANGMPVTNAYDVLAPSVSTEYEAGAKMTLAGMYVTAAWFDINKVNAEVNPQTNTYVHDGREIHEGLEVIAKGKLTDQLTLVGGFTVLDARIAEATALPASNGKIPQGVAEQEARAYFEYAFPNTFLPNVIFVSGVNYYGKRPVDVLNTAFLSPVTTFDAGLRYQPLIWNRRMVFNLTVSNIFDKSYWASYNVGATAQGMLEGTPRLIAFSGKIPLYETVPPPK